MEWMARVTLAVLALAGAGLLVRDKRQYQAFVRLEQTVARQRMLRQFVLESFALFGLFSLALLFWFGRIGALGQPVEPIAELHAALRSGGADEGWRSMLHGLTQGMIPGILVGPTAMTLLVTWKQHRANASPGSMSPQHAAVQPLFPRNAHERRWTTLVALNAGFSEELFFRVVLPMLFVLAGAPPLLAVGAATAWFGLAHLYQGWVGVVGTAFFGGLLLFLYAYTGSLWLVVGIHALIDLNHMATGPWFAERLERRA